MRYYIRHDKNAEVEGPYTIAALADAIRASRIAPDSLASSDLGESVASLQVWRSCDWFSLAAIPELRDVVPPLPELPTKPPRVSVFKVIFFFLASMLYSYRAITERGWLECMLAVLMGYMAVELLVQYVKQRENRSLVG